METKTDLTDILRRYLQRYPDEQARQSGYAEFLDRTDDHRLYVRDNFDGHLTASAFVLDASMERLLLIHHRALDKWLQPGGHIDATDPNILHAAQREVEEETGLPASQLSLLDGSEGGIPFDIDSHPIPANPRKNEDSHVHHDIRFLFKYTGSSDIIINEEESMDYKWVALRQLEGDALFGNMVKKIRGRVGL